MVKLHVVCVATHSKSYFPILLESCKRNNIKLHVLGFNEKWQGFVWRFKLMISFLSTLPKNDIVMFIDAYDVIILKNYQTILDRFQSFKTAILLSKDGDTHGLHTLLYQKVFDKCGQHYINAGSYMGYVFALEKMFDKLCKVNNCNNYQLDDQKMLSSIHKDTKFFNKYIKIDTGNLIFLNIMVKHPLTTDTRVLIKNNKVVNNSKNKIEPCIIHAPGNGDLNPIAKLYNYQLVNINKPTLIQGLCNMLPLYIKFFYTEILWLLLILGIILKISKSKE